MNLGLREAAGNAKNFSESVLVYSDCLQHCHVSDLTVVPHFLIVCIEVEVYDMPQISLSKFFKILIENSGCSRDLCRARLDPQSSCAIALTRLVATP